MRVKLVTDEDVSPWTVLAKLPDNAGSYIEPIAIGPVLCMEVEWLEIRCDKLDVMQKLVTHLSSLGIHLRMEDNAVHIDAYNSPASR